MRVTVLGSAASHAVQGQACSSHLIEGGGARVLFDCGNGSVANLYAMCDPLSLDAIFITHNHPDHYVDLYSLQALVRYAPGGPAGPLALYVPEGLFERMQGLLSERGAEEFRSAFTCKELAADRSVRIGALDITPVPVEHTDPTFALRAQGDGACVVFTSDTAFGDAVRAAVAGSDLLLAEATVPARYESMAPHLTARQAGKLAHEAGASHLVLVHLWPTNDRADALREASEEFGGTVSIARELETFEVVRGGERS